MREAKQIYFIVERDSRGKEEFTMIEYTTIVQKEVCAFKFLTT